MPVPHHQQMRRKTCQLGQCELPLQVLSPRIWSRALIACVLPCSGPRDRCTKCFPTPPPSLSLSLSRSIDRCDWIRIPKGFVLTFVLNDRYVCDLRPFPPRDHVDVDPYCEAVGTFAAVNFGTCSGGTYGTCAGVVGSCAGPATNITNSHCVAIPLGPQSTCETETINGDQSTGANCVWNVTGTCGTYLSGASDKKYACLAKSTPTVC